VSAQASMAELDFLYASAHKEVAELNRAQQLSVGMTCPPGAS